MRRLLRRLRVWLLAPAHDPAPYVALFTAIMLTRMNGGQHGDRTHL